MTPDFGDGWMSRNAQDLFRILVAVGGFDAGELIAALPEGRLNTRMIETAAAKVRGRYGAA